MLLKSANFFFGKTTVAPNIFVCKINFNWVNLAEKSFDQNSFGLIRPKNFFLRQTTSNYFKLWNKDPDAEEILPTKKARKIEPKDEPDNDMIIDDNPEDFRAESPVELVKPKIEPKVKSEPKPKPKKEPKPKKVVPKKETPKKPTPKKATPAKGKGKKSNPWDSDDSDNVPDPESDDNPETDGEDDFVPQKKTQKPRKSKTATIIEPDESEPESPKQKTAEQLFDSLCTPPRKTQAGSDSGRFITNKFIWPKFWIFVQNLDF